MDPTALKPEAEAQPIATGLMSSEELRELARITAEHRTLYCPNCGTPYPPGQKYCTECGRSLDAFDASASIKG